MTIKEFIKKKGWNIECETKPCRWMSVDVSFVNSEGIEDETNFDIKAYKTNELEELFKNFAKENNYPVNTVYGVTITAMAETYEELEKIA